MKAIKRYRRLPQSILDEMFTRATAADEGKKYKEAFRLFLAAARGGESGCQVNLGNCYSQGLGVRRNDDEALYWYKRALRKGERAGANNVGTVYRDQGKVARALAWFHKAVAMGDADANLEIAKLHLKRQPQKAIPYLRRLAGSKTATEYGREEAARLLGRIQKRR